MRTITLPHLHALHFRRSPVRPKPAPAAPLPAEAAVHDTRPRAPALTEEQFWAIGQFRVFGIPLPNRYQTAFFTVLCVTLALPVFLLDKSGQALYHGAVTLVSLAGFAAFCWTVGMLLASTSEDGSEDCCKRK